MPGQLSNEGTTPYRAKAFGKSASDQLGSRSELVLSSIRLECAFDFWWAAEQRLCYRG